VPILKQRHANGFLSEIKTSGKIIFKNLASRKFDDAVRFGWLGVAHFFRE